MAVRIGGGDKSVNLLDKKLDDKGMSGKIYIFVVKYCMISLC